MVKATTCIALGDVVTLEDALVPKNGALRETQCVLGIAEAVRSSRAKISTPLDQLAAYGRTRLWGEGAGVLPSSPG